VVGCENTHMIYEHVCVFIGAAEGCRVSTCLYVHKDMM